MPFIPCGERSKLERALISAIEARAAATSDDAMAHARKMERDAIESLYVHIRQHGCGNAGLRQRDETPSSPLTEHEEPSQAG